MDFERTRRLLEEGITKGQQIGWQIYVWRGTELRSAAGGEAQPGVPMTPQTLMLWMSAGKPLTAMGIAKLKESGELNLEDLITKFIPEFGQNGKENVTLRHLLTHTAPIRRADKIPPTTPWDEMISRICATLAEGDWVPGEKAGYSTIAGWFVLGEILQRISSRPFVEFMRDELLDPLGMHDTHFALDAFQLAEYGNRIGWMHNTAAGTPRRLPLENPEHLILPRPGSSSRGTMENLARFYRCLLNEGDIDGKRVLKEETVREFTTVQRAGMYDHTFMHTLDFGYGFIINSNKYGVETVPYSYGRHAGAGAVGHSGAESSCGFADPHNGIVVCWVLNGLAGERAHQARARELNSAIYEDLGLA